MADIFDIPRPKRIFHGNRPQIADEEPPWDVKQKFSTNCGE